MTTRIFVRHAEEGPARQVAVLACGALGHPLGDPVRLGPGEERDWHLHAGLRLLIAEEAPDPLPAAVAAERMMRHFTWSDEPPAYAAVARWFRDLAGQLCLALAAGPERTAALRKLLEGRDAALRAAAHPGG